MVPVFMIFVLCILFAIDLYTFQGFRLLIAGAGTWYKFMVYAYWMISILLPLAFIIFMARNRYQHQLPGVGVFIGNLWLILLVSKLVFIVFLFMEDISRVSGFLFSKISSLVDSSKATDSVSIASRRKFISQVALGIASLPFASLIYGVVAGRFNYKIHRLTLHFPDLPDAFDGFKITQISDVHSGSFDSKEGVIKGLEMIKSLDSDLLVFTGDLVNTFSEEFDPWIDEFKKLRAPYGQFSILGNHDYGEYAEWKSQDEKQSNFERIKAHHDSIGFRLMLDESVRIEKEGAHLQLLGVENWGQGFGQRGNLAKALSDVGEEDFKILLSHDPTHWEYQVKKHPQQIHLTLSGHTHGMQMGVEIPGFRWSPAQYRYPKWAGHYEENDRHLYINRGFGVLGFRGRAGIWPEITQIELRKA
ncbi:MAG: metallophosphoesterase [Saprospiraceae bacterium]